jgi:hypothetical protein
MPALVLRAVVVASVVIAACGGGGDSEGPLAIVETEYAPNVLHPAQEAVFTAVVTGGVGTVNVSLMRGALAVAPLAEDPETKGTWSASIAWETIADELDLVGAPGEAVAADLRISVRDDQVELSEPVPVQLVCDFASQSVCRTECVEGPCQ